MDGDHKTKATLIYDTIRCEYLCSACGSRFERVVYIGVDGGDRILYRTMHRCPDCGSLFSEVRYG